MIVDVLRNDLGRVARTGSVDVPELLALRSYAAVHHLVARVVARLRDGVTPGALLSATFPGGSITGAPKERAIEILRELEPCPRGLYTGCLIWLDATAAWRPDLTIGHRHRRTGAHRAGGGVAWTEASGWRRTRRRAP
jgi:anthranilate/para-aminobenzoate synthase component I